MAQTAIEVMSSARSARLRRAVLFLAAFLSAACLRADILITTDTVWDASNSPRVIDQVVRVQNGATLTVTNAILKFASGTRLVLESGRLQATDSVFTSLKDDAAGGDTNGDGGASTPAAGDWDNIDTGANPFHFERCDLRYGGSGNRGIVTVGTGAGNISTSLIANGGQVGLYLAPGAAPLVDGCTIQANGTGLKATEGDIGAAVIQSSVFTVNTGWGVWARGVGITIQNNQVTGNGHGISLTASPGTESVVIGNQVLSNSGIGIALNGDSARAEANRVESNNIGLNAASGNPIFRANHVSSNTGALLAMSAAASPQEVETTIVDSPNALNAVSVLGGSVVGSQTWSNAVFPYVIQNTAIGVPAGAALTWAPGVVVKLQSGGGNAARVNVDGTLRLSGTAVAPVVATSFRDDTADGDTNGDGSTTAPAASDWSGLIISAGGRLDIDHTRIAYGGQGALSYNDGASGSVQDSVLESSTWGIGSGAATLSVQNSTFQFNGSGAHSPSGGGTFSFIGNTFKENASDGLQVIGSSIVIRGNLSEQNGNGFVVRAETVNADIEDNVALSNTASGLSIAAPAGARVAGNAFRVNGAGLSLSGRPALDSNRFASNSGAVIAMDAESSPDGLDTSVVEAPGGFNGVDVGGASILSTETWSSSRFAFALRNGAITVGPAAVLRLGAGTVLKAATRPGQTSALIVQGALASEGTETSPVVMTSLADDAAGGDTNGDGAATAPAPGDWTAIDLTRSGSLAHLGIHYGGGGGALAAVIVRDGAMVDATAVSIDHSVGPGLRAEGSTAKLTVSDSLFNANPEGIVVANGAAVTVQRSSFTANGTAVQAAAGVPTVVARFNWWGDSTGPLDSSDDRSAGGLFNPDGKGDSVSDHVDYNPWTGATVLGAPSVTIDEGATVGEPLVHLHLSVTGPATEMRVAESRSFPVNWEPVAPTKTWTLSSGDGAKTLFAQFRAADGSVSDIASAGTVLQNAAPTVAIALSSAPPLGPGTYGVRVTASESLVSSPSLSFTPQGAAAIPVPLSADGALSYEGSISILPATPSGIAQFGVSAVDLSGTTGTVITQGASFAIDTTPPAPPTLTSAIPQSGRTIMLEWTAPAGESGLLYEIHRGTSALSDAAAGEVIATGIDGTAYTDHAPADGVFYYALRSRDEAGNTSSLSNALSANADGTPPVSVTRLDAALRRPSTAAVSWSPPAGEAPAVYAVYRGRDSVERRSDLRIATTTALALSDPLSQSGLWVYGVTTLDALGNESVLGSTASVLVDLDPPTIQSVQLSPAPPERPGPIGITARYSEAMSSAPVPVVRFRPAGGSDTILPATSFANGSWSGLLLIATSTPQGTASLVFTGGADLSGNGAVSSTFTFIIDYSPPPVPTGLRVASAVGDAVQVAWDTAEAEDTYDVFRGTASEGSSAMFVGNTAAVSFTDHPVAGPSRLTYFVRAKDAAGNIGDFAVAVAVDAPLLPLIDAPLDGALVNLPDVLVRGHGQRGAHVRIQTSSGTILADSAVDATGAFAASVHLPSEGINRIEAVALDDAGRASPVSDVRSVNLNSLPSKPATPAGSVGDATVTVTWAPVPDGDISGYWIYRDGAATPLNPVLIPAAALRYTDVALTDGRSYSYRVAAQDGAQQIGEKSGAVRLSPQAGSGWGH